jgi:cytoskeletal protein RodZ
MSENDNSYAQDGYVQIGPTLERVRQELGLTHEDVERVTKIRSRYLEAMERDDYDALPGVVYAQGFLKTYANYLDLDGEKLAQELKHRQSAESAYSDIDEPNERSARANYRDERPGASRFRRARSNRLSPITIIGLVLGLLLLVIVVAGLYFVGLQASRSSSEDAGGNPQAAESDAAPEQNNASQNPDGGAPDEGAVSDAESDGAVQEGPPPEEAGQQNASGAGEEVPEAAPAPEPPPTPPAEPAESPPPESLTMEVRVDGNISWLNIETDGEVVFVEVAEPGFVQTFEANESITVWSGNAGAVFLSLNGQDYGQFGESGQTKVQEFTLKNAEN